MLWYLSCFGEIRFIIETEAQCGSAEGRRVRQCMQRLQGAGVTACLTSTRYSNAGVRPRINHANDNSRSRETFA